MSKQDEEQERRSIRFFERLPNEVTLQIFAQLNAADLAAVAQTSYAGKELASDPELALFQYKLEHKGCLLDQDTAVILRENDPPLYSQLRIISKTQGKVEMSIKPENADKIAAAIKIGGPDVVTALRALSLDPITKFLNGLDEVAQATNTSSSATP
ncbi:hypothetical protein BN59_03472 [Legionella massiliensis]|uniref:F-box domain-containing protein n=1 Tax=Legionella massiliensis TaxID=1034943 RepID=A0A078L506_9GAMM|nr:F-box protein [Legionella massiliensis]CDZ79154.1 hypothetical protein BN59_03472 [Legionella massiliensis]CEE14892.1 hypothetical protein BN1094_03472 [Legionella massiliensis]